MQRPDLLMTNLRDGVLRRVYAQRRAAVDSREPRHVQKPTMGTKPRFTALLALTCVAAAAAQEPPREASVTRAAEVRSTCCGAPVAARSGNVLAVLGADGALVIDSGYPQFVRNTARRSRA